jgi:IclR family acetate operon transcriptional repressor
VPPKTIKVLANADEVLTMLAQRGPLTAAELARVIGMPRPSVYRLLEALEVVGLVAMMPDGRAELGIANLHFAEAALRGLPELQAAKPAMIELAGRTGQTAYFCVRRGSRVVCVDWIQGERVSLMALTPGNSLPLHAGATSRALAASDPSILDLISDSVPLQAFTPYTITSRQALEADAAEITQRGYSVSDQDVSIGVAAIGAVILDQRGRPRGAISIAGLREQILAMADQAGAQLVAAAKEIGARLPG